MTMTQIHISPKPLGKRRDGPTPDTILSGEHAPKGSWVYENAPGLLLTWEYTATNDDGETFDRLHEVQHLGTSQSIAVEQGIEAAEFLLSCLANCGIDWTRTGDDLLAEPGLAHRVHYTVEAIRIAWAAVQDDPDPVMA